MADKLLSSVFRFENWLCLALFSLTPNAQYIFIYLCVIDVYVHFSFSIIGFVLHKKVIILWQAGLDRWFVWGPVDSCSLGRLENIPMAQVWVSLAIGKAPGLTIDYFL